MIWNIHPGEILLKEFMEPLGLNSSQLAKLLEVSSPRINDIILQKRGITADTALRLAHYFKTTPKFWMDIQATYELRKISDKTKKKIENLCVMDQSAEAQPY